MRQGLPDSSEQVYLSESPDAFESHDARSHASSAAARPDEQGLNSVELSLVLE